MSELPPGSPVYRTMRELDENDRPRERLLRHGPEVLSDPELIAIVLGSGLPGENVVDLSRRMLETVGGLDGLVRADVRALQRTRGLGPAKAAQVAAAIELGRRVQRIDPDDRPLLMTPEAVFGYMGWRLLGKTREQLYVLSLDIKGRLLGAPTPIPGSVSAIQLRPGEVFREPIVLDATKAILVHNHPSGDPQPSPHDIETTRMLIAAGELLGIEVEDHVIIGQGRFLSLRREGYAFEREGSRRRRRAH